MTIEFNFVSNNVKGLGSEDKRLKIFKRLKDLVEHKGFIFFQETHSSTESEAKWKENFGKDNDLFFCNGTSNSKGVAIGIVGNIDFSIKKLFSDNKGRLLIMSVSVKGKEYLLINIYNENIEKDQINLLNCLENQLDNFDIDCNTNIILAGDFNFFFDKNLEAKGGNPQLKKFSIAKFLKIKEKWNLIDIWRIKNLKNKKFTFTQNHYSGHLLRRLDYIFVTNLMQTQVKRTDISTALATDHSPITMSISINDDTRRGPGLWKFNKSLLKKSIFVTKLRDLIDQFKNNNIHTADKRLSWELLKYEIRKFSIEFSKKAAKERKATQLELETRLKELESTDNYLENDEYVTKKINLEKIYDDYIEGVRVRSKCNEYELGEKSNKYFLNLEKYRAKLASLNKILDNDDREITDKNGIQNELKKFYSNLFTDYCKISKNECSTFLNSIELKTLNDEETASCGKILSEQELQESVEAMQDGKSPGNDGLSTEFYKAFWEDIKQPFFASIIESRIKGSLSNSQRQAIIKLIEKKDRDKTRIKNWRPISLLNVDTKIISKAFATRLKEVLPSIIGSEQTAYVKNRFIGEGGRLISDILEVTDTLNINGFLVTIDFEKAFDSLNHTFLIETLIKIGFPSYFIEWIKILLKDQESCVMNGGLTTPYFKLERGARQGDPISAYLFIIALEVLFLMIKHNNSIKPLNILNHNFLYSAYADDASFFVRDIDSIKQLVSTLKLFYKYSDLKPNYDKCEIAGCGGMKGALGALCGMKSVDLTNNSMKILGIHFSYNKELKLERNFIGTVRKIEKLLGIWRQRSLTLEGKIVIFKTLAISKIVYISYLSETPNIIIENLEKLQNDFLWNGKRAKINHNTLCNKFSKGGLQKVDIKLKINALQMSWIKRLNDPTDHQWKIIPNRFLVQAYGISRIFYPHFLPRDNILSSAMPVFYKSILKIWSKCSNSPIDIRNCLSQYLWENEYVKIANKPYTIKEFYRANIHFVYQIFINGRPKTWIQAKDEFGLDPRLFFKYLQLVNSIPQDWKNIIATEPEFIMTEEHCHTQGVLVCTRIVSLKNLVSKQIYDILLRKRKHTPTAQTTLKRKITSLENMEWSNIYYLPRNITKDPYLRYFQYKILNNTLYLNQRLHAFGKSPTRLCSFCDNHDETPQHIFSDCHYSLRLWNSITFFFNPILNFPSLTPQSALVGFHCKNNSYLMLINHLLLLYKVYVYRSRINKHLIFENLLTYIKSVFKLEIQSQSCIRSDQYYSIKWDAVRHLLEN